MCDFIRNIGDEISRGASSIGNVLTRAVTPPGTGGRAAQAEIDQALARQQNQIASDTLTFAKQSQADAKVQNDTALAEQKKATDIATAASVPAIDSEAARIAADQRTRKLLSAGAFGVSSGLKNLGAAPLGYRASTGV